MEEESGSTSELHSFEAPSVEPGSQSVPEVVAIRVTGARQRQSWREQTWVTWLGVAVAAGLLFIVAAPPVWSHSNRVVAAARPSATPIGSSHNFPYQSPIPGVDDLYLRGVYAYEQRTPESLGRSRDDFSAAIAKDPNYAPAYAGLSNTYNLLREYSVMPEPEAYAKAREAAQHAIVLDPKLPEAHASLGFIDFFWSWDAVAAEREFRAALALDPSSVVARHWYGSMLLHEGRFGEALEQLELAQRLAPTSVAVLSTRAYALGLSGRRAEAEEMLQDAISATPDASSPRTILAILSGMQPRDPERFVVETRRVGELRHSDAMLQLADAAKAGLRAGGEKGMWKAILALEEKRHPGTEDRTYLMVDAKVLLGRNEEAIADLMWLAQRHDPQVMGLVVDPSLAPLHQDRRFIQLVAKLGLPPVAH